MAMEQQYKEDFRKIKIKKLEILIQNKKNICKNYENHKEKAKTIYEIDMLLREYLYLKVRRK